jgi:hypothetical protein
VINTFTEHIDKAISSSTIVLSSNIQKHFSPDGKTLYLKGSLIFLDSSVLEIALFVIETHDALTIEKYIFHYMKPHGQMLFRYDNAPPHPEITSHPHHKHISENVIPSRELSLNDVLDEISAIIVG